MSEQALAPCPLPWCGKPATLWRDHEGVRCSDDNCILWDADIPPADWNRRADTLEVPEGWRVESVSRLKANGGYFAEMFGPGVEVSIGTGATIAEAVRKAREGIG